MKLIGIYLVQADPAVRKCLKEHTWYPFGNYKRPEAGNGWRWMQEVDIAQEDLLSWMYKASVLPVSFNNTLNTQSDYKTWVSNTLQVSVSCIVGKNGSGKSTLLEILFRIINNFAYRLLETNEKSKNNPQKGRDLVEAKGFDATLYFETDGSLGFIRYYYGNLRFEYLVKDNNIRIIENFKNPISLKQKKLILQRFFYTICNNYSIYSFNSNDYNSGSLRIEEEGLDGKWLHGLFHKNDAYLAPIVINPYRDEGGSIDVENENDLAKQRLSALAVLFTSQGKTFLQEYKAAYIDYQFDIKAEKKYYQKFEQLIITRLPLSNTDTVRGILKLEWEEYLRKHCPNYETTPGFIQETILSYLSYKTLKICLNYRSFGELIDIKEIEESDKDKIIENWTARTGGLTPFNERQFEYMMKAKFTKDSYRKIIKKITSPDEYTHITLKVHQCIEYINRGNYKTADISDVPFDVEPPANSIAIVNLLKDNIIYDRKVGVLSRNSASYNTYSQAYVILPPPFFKWELRLLHKNDRLNAAMDNGISINKLSSGEKHRLYTTSSLLYHINNISSIKQDSHRQPYHHINIVMDEAELYFHPEYQRGMISDIMTDLMCCHIDKRKIRSINLIIVTHSPFVLSDVPLSHSIYLDNGEYINRTNQTFCANIHNLLYDKFIVHNTIGEVSKTVIEIILQYYYNRHEMTERMIQSYHKDRNKFRMVVAMIADKYISSQVVAMLDELDSITEKNL